MALNPSKNLKINAPILIFSGLVLLALSVLTFLLILKYIYGDFSLSEIIPTKENLTLISEIREKKAAILYSKYTENMLPEGNTWLIDNVSAWESYLISIRMDYELIDDMKLETGKINEYGLLILPGAKSLSDKQIIELKKYLENGGSILSTGGTSTFSDDGKWRGWDFFSEVFGLKFTKELSPSEDYKIHTLRGNLPVTSNIPAGYALKVATWDRPICAEVLDPRTKQVSMWYNYRSEEGLVREKIQKTAGIAYGRYGKGRFFWMGFEINSVVGSNMDFIYYDRLLSNSINWLTSLPTVYVKEWPSPFNSASIFIPTINESPNNILNLVNILRTYEYPVSFFIRQEVAEKNTDLVQSLKIYGDVNPIINIQEEENPDDTTSILMDYDMQENQFEKTKKLLFNRMGEVAKGIMPLNGLFDENTLKLMVNNELKYLVTDSLTDRSAPRIEIRDDEPVLIITKTARDDKVIINDYGLKDKNFQLYTYQEDIDRVIFESGLYVLKLHSSIQLKPEYVDVVKDICKYIRSEGMWMTSVKEMENWWLFRSNLEIRLDIRSSKRLNLEISSPEYETTQDFVVQININKPVENVIVSSDIINMEIPLYEYKEDEQILYLYFNGFAEDETRSFLIDYENIR